MQLLLLKSNHESQNTGIFFKGLSTHQEVIERSNTLTEKELISNVVQAIKQAQKIDIYGVRSSGLSASEMMQRLLRMDFNVYCISILI